MLKLISNYKKANYLVEETKKSIETVKGWDSKMCKPFEKQQEIAQLEVNLNKFYETKLRVIEELEAKLSKEKQELQNILND